MSSLKPELPPDAIDRVIDVAIAEDLVSGDLTSLVCVEADAEATGVANARHAMVVCGGPVFARVFARIDSSVSVETMAADGERVEAGAELWKVSGRARSILATSHPCAELARWDHQVHIVRTHKVLCLFTYIYIYIQALTAL